MSEKIKYWWSETRREEMGYYELPPGSPECELGRKIYMEALSDRRGFRDDQLGIHDPEIWREIFEAIGAEALRQIARS